MTSASSSRLLILSAYRPSPISRAPSRLLAGVHATHTANYHTSLASPIHPRNCTPISSSRPSVSYPPPCTRSSSSFNPWKMNSDIEYRDLKPITDMPSDVEFVKKNKKEFETADNGDQKNHLDVREESEVIQGNIPSSVNIPISRFEKTLDMHPDEFLKTVGFRKPRPDQKIVFYCRSGARSARALEIARLKGFKNLRNYKGSWLDWMDKETSA